MYLVEFEQNAPDIFGDLGNHRVAQPRKPLGSVAHGLVHPIGNPCNHSTNWGFKRRGKLGALSEDISPSWIGGAGGEWGNTVTASCKSSCPSPRNEFGEQACGVGHVATCSFKGRVFP